MKKKISIIIIFIITTIIFNIAAFYLPPNFHGIRFYGLLFLVDIFVWRIIRIDAINCVSIRQRYAWQRYARQRDAINCVSTFGFFLPYFLLVLVALAGIFYPIPDWNIYVKLTISTILFAFWMSHAVFVVCEMIVNFRFQILNSRFQILNSRFQILNSRLKISNSRLQAKRNHPSFSFLFSVFILLVCLTAPFTWTNKIRTSELVVSNKDIPMAFDGYKIVQLSDIHADYFPKGKLLEEAVDIINKVNADLILITGDFVSYKSAELNHLMEILKRFQSTDGVYVVLGNHDYGTYYHWKNEELKENNFKELLSCFNNLDWNLLQNETVFIVKDNDSIALAGTEHYSRKESHYPSAANINLALKDVPKTMPVICMTHNPEYWADTIRYIDNYVFLTLSGHTHGMQIGIHGNAKINMYRLKNKFTAGLYKNGNRYLYINTGFGTVGFPFRIGLKPEITVVELRVM